MTGRLVVDIEKRFPGGPSVRAAFEQPGEGFHATVLFGPSGGGKTTVLRCIAGLERPTRGSIRMGGQTWFDAAARIEASPQRRGIGLLFQDYALFPHLTAERNIGYGIGRTPRNDRRRRMAELIEVLGLAGLERRYPHELSAGQQQRVALARAVAPRPRLLLLDEPLAALDAPARESLRRELRRLLAAFGIPAVIVTHDAIEAVSLADQAVILSEGQTRQSGPVHEVFSRPTDPTVARIVGVETIEPGVVAHVAQGLASVRAGSVEIFALAGSLTVGPVYVCIRGEDVTIELRPAPASSARNQLPARVVSLLPEGPTVRVVLDCGFRLTALVTSPAARQLELTEGSTVVALVKAQAIHLVAR